MEKKTLTEGGMNEGKKGKKERKGFKQDRYEKYKLQFDKKARQKAKEDAKKGPVRVKEVRFDAKEREDWLTSRHKEKNKRRVQAVVDHRLKRDRETSKLRKDLREEARQQYNQYAKVPILPDFSYTIPKYVDALGRPGVDAAEDGEEDGEPVEEQEVDNNDVMAESTFYEDADAGYGEGVRVEVKPLQSSTPNMTKTRGRGGGMNFSDLPDSVAAELAAVQAKQDKGFAQQKRKLHMMKEMQKIQKIRKHCRKGAHKKSKSGKKKNR